MVTMSADLEFEVGEVGLRSLRLWGFFEARALREVSVLAGFIFGLIGVINPDYNHARRCSVTTITAREIR